jgi:hypothetical protein
VNLLIPDSALAEYNTCHAEDGKFCSTPGKGSATDSPAFKAWFRDSVVTDKTGQPAKMFHSTGANPDYFRPFSHFGTAKAANDRFEALHDFSVNVVGRKAAPTQMVPVYLSIQNPLRLPDLASLYVDDEGRDVEDSDREDVRPRSWESETDLAEILYKGDHITSDEFWEVQYSPKKAMRLLTRKGYDGIVYNNAVEDPGNDSYIIFKASQVKSAIANRGAFDKRKARFTEFNPCHEPAGSVIGGRFAPKKGGSCGTQTSGTAGGGRAGVSAASRPTPNAAVQDVAAKYAVSLGLPVPRGGYAPVDQNLAGQIADAYDALPVADLDNPAVVRAYTALAAEVQAQWDFAEAQGMTFTPWTKDGQPYQTSVEMAEDVQKNKHLAFFTGGDDHPFLGSSTKDKRGLTLNDKFRAIHDYFGHAAGGYGFGARGEENAWISHSQMFTPMARRAMTTETRGQNSWVNFGRQNYDADGNPKNIPAGDRPFATQKVALLPDRFVFG